MPSSKIWSHSYIITSIHFRMTTKQSMIWKLKSTMPRVTDRKKRQGTVLIQWRVYVTSFRPIIIRPDEFHLKDFHYARLLESLGLNAYNAILAFVWVITKEWEDSLTFSSKSIMSMGHTEILASPCVSTIHRTTFKYENGSSLVNTLSQTDLVQQMLKFFVFISFAMRSIVTYRLDLTHQSSAKWSTMDPALMHVS